MLLLTTIGVGILTAVVSWTLAIETALYMIMR